MYKRVMLKISGEQLAGKHDVGIDTELAHYLAKEIKLATAGGTEMVIVVGGGNMVRGAEVAGNGIRRVTADQMGMLSGLMNAMALTDIFESEGLPTRCVSNVFAEQVVESYSYRLAEKHLANKRILVVAGGSGRPYVTHDTAAVMIALELDCEVVMKSTKVDGVYDKDPNRYKDAVLLPTITFQQAVEDQNIKVMDKAALGLAMEQNKALQIFSVTEPGNIARAVAGKSIGTRVS